MITLAGNWSSLYTTASLRNGNNNTENNLSANDISSQKGSEVTTLAAEQTAGEKNTDEKTSGAGKESSSKEDADTAVTLTLSKIQQYMSRSRQLEAESKEDDVTASGRRQIQSEINKINVVVSNLSVGNDSDQVENMVNSIDMTGNLVSHYAGNILTNAEEAYYAQGGINNMEAYALLV